jgi:hypothetical protein
MTGAGVAYAGVGAPLRGGWGPPSDGWWGGRGGAMAESAGRARVADRPGDRLADLPLRRARTPSLAVCRSRPENSRPAPPP